MSTAQQPAATPASPVPAASQPQSGAAPAAGPANNQQQQQNANSFASGSLYVGDLANDVTEALLFEIFNQVGPVSSIRVCRDAATRMSLGYAYVNFHSVVDAERALDTLNFTNIKNQPCRIMWSHRDPSIRRSNVGNIFIKNLDKGIDNKSLYDTFSAFGNILSCKVAMDGASSKGYGFVHYETEKGANAAIERVNGMLLNGKQVYVGKFERRTDRSTTGKNQFTNVYVKNIPEEWDEEKFRTEFSKFGQITSLYMKIEEEEGEKKHKGFGFVNYESHEEAEKACEEGSKLEVGADNTLFVDRFQKKSERSAMLSKKYMDMRREKTEKFKNLNLYVKNLEDDVDDEKLKEMFTTFGEIASAIIMKDEKGASRGFGFVCFADADDATKALNEMNGKMIGTKPLYVNRAQRKEDRRMQLESQFQANMAGQRMQPMAPVFYAPPGSMMPQPGMMYPQPMMGRRYPQNANVRGGYPMYPGPMKRGGRTQGQGRPGMPPQNRPGAQKFRGANPNARFPRDGQPPMQVPAVAAPVMAPQVHPNQGQELTSHALASATPAMQKQMLGERLFPLVQKSQPDLAGKITGMLLEMDVSEILALLEPNSIELDQKVTEAMEVLQSHEE